MSELALKLIAKEKKERTGKLDLGKCGLTEIPEEVFELTWLEELKFSNRWINYKKNRWEESVNSGDDNQFSISSLPEAIKQLKVLKAFFFGGDDMKSWSLERADELQQLTSLQSLYLINNKITDISFLSKLTGLQSLNLSDNQITDYSFLSKLTSLQSLDLRSNQITDISFLSKLTSLQSLDLSDNQITDISFLSKLTSLQSLYLINNKITDISFLSKLTSLQSLYLINNKITDISFLSKLTSLQSLDLRSNQIIDISFLSKLTGLQSLNLSDNQITDYSFLSKLTSLQSLHLRSNQITDISFLSKLTSLQSLHLRSNQITDISFLSKLTSLQSLDLSDNQITDISFLSKLTSLQSLDLSDNQITDYSFLSKLTSLQSLHLSYNQITDISFLSKLTSLQSLHLSYNQITDISFISKLTSLQSLDLSDNQITDISFISKLTSLQSLHLSDNQITDISFLSKLTSLQSLHLSYNKITDYSFLSKLTSLQSLHLSYNKITDYSFLSKLTSLQSLDLSDNQITDISFLSKLTSLQRLHLSDNQITDISSLKELIRTSLKLNMSEYGGGGLMLYNNPIIKPPLEIVEQGNEAVVNWLDQAEEQGTEPFYEAKVMILGQGGAGKTTFTELQLNPNYQVVSGGQKSTLGVVIHKGKDFPHSDTSEVMIKGHLWDFGGQDIQKMLHQFFITTNCLYILVSDKRAENTNYDYWFQVINLLGPESPVIVVENPKDMDAVCEDFPLVKYKRDYPALPIDGIEVNLAKTRTDDEPIWDLLNDKIRKLLSGLEIVNRPVPRKWLMIREELKSKNRGKHITKDLFYDISGSESIGLSKPEADLCLRYLNDIGELVYFDDRSLENYIFLDHNWLIKGMYFILSDKRIKDAKGKFTKNQAYKAWESEGYKSLEKNLLLELLLKDKFDICYQLPGKPNTFITPLLIPGTRTMEWPYGISIRFRYEYDFMPLGMFSRLIVKLHKKIDNEIRWKSGVRLVDQFNGKPVHAEVEEYNDPEGNRDIIEILLDGDEEGCKELLNWIRLELESLHEDFGNLQFKRKVACNCPSCDGSRSQGQKPGFHSYKRLLTRLSKGLYTIDCEVTEEPVNIGQILGDLVLERASKESADMELHNLMWEKGYTMNSINVTQSNHQNVTQSQKVSQEVSIQIQNIQTLKDEASLISEALEKQKDRLLKKLSPEEVEDAEEDLATIQESLANIEEAEKNNQKPDNKIARRFGQVFKDFEDEESPIRKTLKSLRRGKDYAVNLARTYNKVAENIGMPSVPPLALDVIEKL